MHHRHRAGHVAGDDLQLGHQVEVAQAGVGEREQLVERRVHRAVAVQRRAHVGVDPALHLALQHVGQEREQVVDQRHAGVVEQGDDGARRVIAQAGEDRQAVVRRLRQQRRRGHVEVGHHHEATGGLQVGRRRRWRRRRRRRRRRRDIVVATRIGDVVIAAGAIPQVHAARQTQHHQRHCHRRLHARPLQQLPLHIVTRRERMPPGVSAVEAPTVCVSGRHLHGKMGAGDERCRPTIAVT